MELTNILLEFDFDKWHDAIFTTGNYTMQYSIRNAPIKNFNFEKWNFSEIKFENCTIEDCTFYNCNFSKAKFVNCRFKSVEFENCDLNQSEFELDFLHAANFVVCNFVGAWIANSTLENVKIYKSAVSNIVFTKNKLNAIVLKDTPILNSKFIDCSWNGGNIVGNSHFHKVNILICRLVDTFFSHIVFNCCVITNSEFEAVKFNTCNFDFTEIYHSNFIIGTKISSSEFIGSKLDYVKFPKDLEEKIAAAKQQVLSNITYV